MESHISLKWKSLDIISSQDTLQKNKPKWKQKSKPTTMSLTNFGQIFLLSVPLENGRKPHCFLMCPWGKERKHWPKMS